MSFFQTSNGAESARHKRQLETQWAELTHMTEPDNAIVGKVGVVHTKDEDGHVQQETAQDNQVVQWRCGYLDGPVKDLTNESNADCLLSQARVHLFQVQIKRKGYILGTSPSLVQEVIVLHLHYKL